MNGDTLTRRELLKKTLHLAVIGAAVPVAAACSGSKKLDCSDVSALATADKQLRTSLAYVDASPHGEAKNCTNCNFYQAAGVDQCGACTLVKGPIHPLGYCNSWAAKA